MFAWTKRAVNVVRRAARAETTNATRFWGLAGAIPLTGSTLVTAVVVALVVWSFWPLTWIGYTTSDDVAIGLQSLSDNLRIAIDGSRLTWLMGAPLVFLGAIHGDQWFSKLPGLLSILTLLASLAFMVRELSGSRPLSLMASLLAAVFWQNGWQHNGFTSYPVVFTLALAMVFLAVALYQRFLARLDWRYGVAAAAVFFLSFTSELFVTLVWAQLLLLACRWNVARRAGGIRDVVVWSIPALAPVALFTLSYFYFAQGKPGLYELDVSGFAAVLWTYSMSGFPGLGISFNGPISRMFSAASGWEVALAVAKGILAVVIVSYCSKAARPRGDIRAAAALLAAGVLFAFWVNVPVAVTERYQSWVRDHQSTAYIYTTFSTLGFAVGFACLAAIAGSSRGPLARGFLGALLAFFGVVTTLTSLNNANVFRDQKLSQSKWVFVDDLARAGVFQSLPADAVVLAPGLYACHNIVCFRTRDYWTRYLRSRFGIDVDVRPDDTASGHLGDRPVYRANFVPGVASSHSRNHGVDVLSFPLSQATLPPQVALVRGLSGPESWGRWTEGAQTELVLSRPLPRDISVRLDIDGAFGPNTGATFKAIVGDDSKDFTVVPGVSRIELSFSTKAPSHSIRIVIPKPASPAELGISRDSRKLGLGIRSVSFRPNDR